MEIVSATALISINETFFVQLISFLVFLFILNRVMFRPLINTIDQRKAHFADAKSEIDKAKSDLVNLNKELDRQRSRVLNEANAAIHKMEAEAEHQASEVMASGRQQISELRHETEEKVNQQLKEVRTRLAGEADALTTLIMEKVLHRSLQS
jgi:F-type H+-transporting ATPase subunit b